MAHNELQTRQASCVRGQIEGACGRISSRKAESSAVVEEIVPRAHIRLERDCEFEASVL